MLTEAVVLSLALQCAPAVAPDTIAIIAHVESGSAPLAIHDNATDRRYEPTSPADAIALATDLIVVQRHNVDLGLMQITSANLRPLGLSIGDAFDPCRSIAAGAKVLSDAYQQALRSALSQYNTGDPHRGIDNGYVGRIERAAVRVPSIVPSVAAASQPAALATVPPNPTSWDVHAASGGTAFVYPTQ